MIVKELDLLIKHFNFYCIVCFPSTKYCIILDVCTIKEMEKNFHSIKARSSILIEFHVTEEVESELHCRKNN